MDEVLFLLVKEGALTKPVRLSTISIGSLLNMSQQNASRRLRQLLQDGLVSKSGQGLLITTIGKQQVLNEYETLGEALGKKQVKKLRLGGVVVKGLGEGSFYVSKYSSRLQKLLGKKPYPGTLNVELDEKSKRQRMGLDVLPHHEVGGFEDGGRQYGALKIYHCFIGTEKVAILVPARTHHPTNIIEIVATKRLKKQVGDRVVVELR
jgi:riboflavin kinase